MKHSRYCDLYSLRTFWWLYPQWFQSWLYSRSMGRRPRRLDWCCRSSTEKTRAENGVEMPEGGDPDGS